VAVERTSCALLHAGNLSAHEQAGEEQRAATRQRVKEPQVCPGLLGKAAGGAGDVDHTLRQHFVGLAAIAPRGQQVGWEGRDKAGL
jgi:hypothetical protein